MTTATQKWEALIRQQAVQRSQHARQCALAGYGQPVDEPLWPVLDRLWALGLVTSGSCAGHPSPNSALWSKSYVIFRHQSDVRMRWRRLVWTILEQSGAPGVTHQVESDALKIIYSDRGWLSGEVKWRQGIQDWVVAIDEAAIQTLSDGEVWNAWDGPALVVPDNINPSRLYTEEWHDYLKEIRQHDERDFHVLTLGMDAHSLSDVATQMSWSLDDITTRWNHVWDVWRERQFDAVHPFDASPEPD